MENGIGKYKIVTGSGYEYPIGSATEDEAKKIAQTKKQEEGMRQQAVKLILLDPKLGGVEVSFE